MTVTEHGVEHEAAPQGNDYDTPEARGFLARHWGKIGVFVVGSLAIGAGVVGIDRYRDEASRKSANSKLEGIFEERGANDLGIRVLVRGKQDKLKVSCDNVEGINSEQGRRYVTFSLVNGDGEAVISLPDREPQFDADGVEVEPGGMTEFGVASEEEFKGFLASEDRADWCQHIYGVTPAN